MKKIRPIKNPWFDWLINYIFEPIRKSVCSFKDKAFSLFKRNHVWTGKKLRKPKIQKESEEKKLIASERKKKEKKRNSR